MTTQIPEWMNAVGPGWHPILVKLHEDIVKELPDYTVSQVKEKFGGLRVYLACNTPMPVHELIMNAEKQSFTTCELCGQPGTPDPLPPGKYWVRTLCNDCRHKRASS